MKRKFISMFLLVCMLLPQIIISANNGAWTGTGTSADPYIIAAADDLKTLALNVNGGETYAGKFIKLTADISLNGSEENQWTAIGQNTNQFKGTFDGGGHKINGLYINKSSENYQGLFGYIGKGGTVKNLTVEGTVTGGDGVGGVTGYNDGTISDCRSMTAVTGAEQAGAIAGLNNGGTVLNCCNNGNVTGDTYVGGIAGYNGGTVSGSYNTGNVTGTYEAGGIVGWNYKGEVSDCYNTGAVTGKYEVGGAVGLNYIGTVSNSYNAGTVTAKSEVGGVVGNNSSGTVSNCYYDKTIYTLNNTTSGVTGKTTEQFASGEVAALLQNNRKTQVWGQTAGTGCPELTNDTSKTVYKIVFQADGKEYAAAYANYNGTVTLPENPTLDNYKFEKWVMSNTSNAKEFTADTAVTRNMTVYAIFTLHHTLIYHAAVNVDCESAGEKEYWACKVCSRKFSDADGTTEIEDVTIPATGHNWSKWEFTSNKNEMKASKVCQNNSLHKESRDLEIRLSQTQYTYNGKECKPSAAVNIIEGETKTALAENSDYKLTYKNNINAGTATVTITGIGEYSGTIDMTFNIEKRTLTPVAATVENRQYDGTTRVNVTAVELNGVAEGDTAAITTENLQGTLNSANAGTYTEVTLQNLSLVNNEKNNYTLYQSNITLPTEVTIGKADVPAVTAGRLNIANNLKKEYTYLLSRLCPMINEQDASGQKDWGKREYEISDISFTQDGYYDKGTAYISTAESGGVVNNTVYLPVKFNDTKTTGAVGEVTIKIVSTNYKDFENKFAIYAGNKTAVIFDGITAQNGTYNGNPWQGYTGMLTVTDENGSGLSMTPEIRYSGRLNTGYSERAEAPANAGTYSVIFRASDNDENYIGKRTVNFEITKADGSASVAMADFNIGDTPGMPVPSSQTNGTNNVTYVYKPFGADDSEYTSVKPTDLGKYTVKAIFAETQNYNSVTATADFTINVKPSPTPTAKPRRKGGGSVKTTPKPAATPKVTAEPSETAVPTASPDNEPQGDTDNQHKAYIVGYEGNFNPDGNITRTETAAILARLTDGFEENESYTTTFTDVDNTLWYYKYVGFAEDTNILTGYTDGTFKPEESITRAEFASVIARFAELTSANTDVPFSDISLHWAAEQIASCYEAGYITGYEDSTFMPDNYITRAEAVSIINRVTGRNDIKDFENPFNDVPQTHWAYTDIMEAAITHNVK